MTNKTSQYPRFVAFLSRLGKRGESLRVAIFSGLNGKSPFFLATVGLLICSHLRSHSLPVSCNVFFRPHSLTGFAVPDGDYGALSNDIAIAFIRVPPPAMCSGALAFGSSAHVYGLRDGFQMSRIATRPVTTQMIQLHAFSDRAIGEDIGHTVSAKGGHRLRPVLHGTPVKVPVSITPDDPGPNPASGLRDLAPTLNYGQEVFNSGSLPHGASILDTITRHT